MGPLRGRKRNRADAGAPRHDRADAEASRHDDERRERHPEGDRERRGDEPRHERGPAGVDRERQREEFGGFNFGAAFFGWLVAVGITVLLTALLSAAGTAIGLTELTPSEAESSAGTLSLIGGILLIVVLALGYYAGGYVAGRMSRFDGARQGLGVWLIGLVVTIILAVAGAVAGSEYNVLAQLNLPRIPIDEGTLTTGGVIALAVILIATALAALLGGTVGRRYHGKVDRAGLVDHR